MKSKILKRGLFAVVLLVLLPMKPDEFQAITEDDVKRAERELQAAQDQEQALENQLNELNNNISDTRHILRRLTDGYRM